MKKGKYAVCEGRESTDKAGTGRHSACRGAHHVMDGDEDDVGVATPAAEATVCVMLASFAVNLTAGLSAANMLIKNGRRGESIR